MCVYCGGQHRPLSLDHFNELSLSTTQTVETWTSPPAAPAAAGGLPNLIETTDAAGNASTAYTLGIGQSVRGQVAWVGDNDWFAVNLTAGQTYTVAMVGTGTNNVQDTYLRLYAGNGTTLLAQNDDGLQSANSIFTYTAATSGTYYISAAAFDNSGTGQYGVSVAAGSRASFDIAMGAGVIDTDRSWSAPGAGATVTYGFRANTNGNAPNFSLLTAAEANAVRLSLQQYSEVANLNFTEVNPGGYTNNATMLFANYFSSTDGAGAYAYYPGSTAATANEGDVWLNTNSVSTTSLPIGSWSYITVLHEIGHALGLSHPGVYNAGPGQTITYTANAQFVEDTMQFTVMSYFDEGYTGANHGGFADTLMMFDIQAVQAIYGANMSTRTGNTVYGFGSNAGAVYDFAVNTNPAVCIWDAGGTDTLNCSGFGQNQTINLTAGQFSHVGGLTSNVSIVLGAVIENAKGGGGSDSINGNDFANDLQGNGGSDTLKGGGGADRLTGGSGSDTLIGGAGTDVAVFSGARSSYQITQNADNSLRVSDLRQGAPDGIDILFEVEQGSFADGLFNLSGPTGASEITVMGNGTSIADGDGTPGTGDHTDFGSVTQGGGVVVRTFTVRNDGSATLTLNTPALPTGFTLVEGLAGSLAPGASDTFQVRLDSGNAGTWAGDISITNNDGNESPFNFRITGTVNAAPGGGSIPPLGDVLWQHTDGTIRTADHNFGAVSGTWQIRGTADFDGDGDTDILWRHQEGSIATWELENGQFYASHSIGFASTGWDIVNSGDFDADGDADILWRHQDGAVVTWEMENGAYLTNHNIAFASGGWGVDGLGDFDGDGDDDIVWRHRDGAVVTWEMENGAYVVNHNIAFAPANWRIAATADFDADGDDDILWHHSEGMAVAWEMENGNYVVNHNLPWMEPAWRIAGAQDFDSDGDSDILWRNTDGTVVTWEMQNAAFAGAHNFGVVSNAWQIRGTGEFDMV